MTLTLIYCIVAVSQLCVLMKIFHGAQKYHHFDFLIVFKCVAISHQLNPGATPWYFTT